MNPLETTAPRRLVMRYAMASMTKTIESAKSAIMTVPIRDREKSKVIAFAQESVGCGHEPARDDCAASDRHQIYDDEHDETNREREERNHDRADSRPREVQGNRVCARERRLWP